MTLRIFGKKRACPKCRKTFSRYKSERRSEEIKGSENRRIYWLDVCPHCEYVFNEGHLIDSHIDGSITDLLRK